MHLHENEKVNRIIRRHATPFFFSIFKILFAGGVFLFVTVFFGKTFSEDFVIIAVLIIALFMGFATMYRIITYRLDRLILTNQRIVWINWKSLFRREEHEMAYKDIQDIHTLEKGFLSYIKMFDYGVFQIETSASKTTICFEDAPDPEGIKHYILQNCMKQVQ